MFTVAMLAEERRLSVVVVRVRIPVAMVILFQDESPIYFRPFNSSFRFPITAVVRHFCCKMFEKENCNPKSCAVIEKMWKNQQLQDQHSQVCSTPHQLNRLAF